MEAAYHEGSQLTPEPGHEPGLRPAGFTQIPNAVIRDASLSRNARMTYVVLASYAWGERDYCFPGQATLAGHLGCSERKVRDYLSELVDAGYLEKKHRGQGNTDWYTFKHSTSGLDRNYGSDLDRTVGSAKEYEAEEYEDISLRGASAPPEDPGEGSRAGSRPDPAEIASCAPSDEDRATLAKRLTGVMVSGLKKEGHHLDEDQRQKWGRNLKVLVKDGVGADELERVVARIVSEWWRFPLSPQQALSDLRGDRDVGVAAKPSPPEVIEALRGHATLSRFASLAERFDFTTEEAPAGRDWYALGGTSQEANANLVRLRSVARKAVKAAAAADRTAQIAAIQPDQVLDGQDRGARIASKGLEDGPEGCDTPEADAGGEDGQDSALPKALDRITGDPDGHITSLARAVVLYPDGSITSEHVAEAVAAEVDLEALGFSSNTGPMGAGLLASLIIRRVRDQIEERNAGQVVAM